MLSEKEIQEILDNNNNIEIVIMLTSLRGLLEKGIITEEKYIEKKKLIIEMMQEDGCR